MNKYNAIRVNLDGHNFHSKKEAERYLLLKDLEKRGLIKNLELQPSFIICRSVNFNGKSIRAKKYIADFRYYDRSYNRMIVEDVKGKLTDLYKLKRSLFISQYPEYLFKET